MLGTVAANRRRSVGYVFPPPGALWSAGHEAGLPLHNNANGEVTKWHGFTSSGVASEHLATSPEPTKTGANSLRLHADVSFDPATVASGIRSRVEKNITGATPGDAYNYLPVEGYYSCWYYVPVGGGVRGANGGTANWNIFQYKQYDPVDLTMHLLFFCRLDWVSADSNYRLHLRRDMDTATGEWTGDVQPTTSMAISTNRVPEGEWFHVEFYLKRAQDATGAIKVWLNGEQFADFTGIFTSPDWAVAVDRYYQWTVNNYMTQGGAAHDPAVTDLYVDDVAISLSRIGPTGQGS
jgi:hypothetical protein